MIQKLKKYSLFLCLSVILVFGLFAINQLVALYANLAAIEVWLANIVVSLVALLVFVLFSLPVVLLLRLPKTILNEGEEPAQYESKLKKRLATNKRIKRAGLETDTPEGLKEALVLLDNEALQVINKTATSVFLTTAVSQNGKLDALTVFVTQSRMVWKIAHIYWQRPALQDIVRLYANVGGASLVASELEDLDLTRQIEPILSALLKSPGRSLPVVGHAAHILTDSLLEGSTNAFLTLRVGVIAKRYCGSLSPDIPVKELKRSAFLEASTLLRTLVLSSSGKVINSVMKAMKNAGKNTVTSGVEAVGRAASKVKTGILKAAGKNKKELPATGTGSK